MDTGLLGQRFNVRHAAGVTRYQVDRAHRHSGMFECVAIRGVEGAHHFVGSIQVFSRQEIERAIVADSTETTVWACKNCGRSANGPSSETCQHCAGTMGQLAESAAMRRFMEYWEPPTGWRDYETLVEDWNADRVHPDARVR